MRGIIFILGLSHLGKLVCDKGIVQNQVQGHDMVEVLVGELVNMIKESGTFNIVRELVDIFREFGSNAKILTKEIRNLIKKIKKKRANNERILPQGIVHLLKAKISIDGKKTILEKLLTQLQYASPHDNNLQDDPPFQLSLVAPKIIDLEHPNPNVIDDDSFLSSSSTSSWGLPSGLVKKNYSNIATTRVPLT